MRLAGDMRVNLRFVFVGAAQILCTLVVFCGITGIASYSFQQWVFILCIGIGYAIANIAKSKGYSAANWFIYGALIWPVALIHIISKPPLAGSKQFEAKVALLRAAQQPESTD